METPIKEILRPQWDQREQAWKIVKKTYNGNGGWSRFGTITNNSKQLCQDTIDRLVRDYPDCYESDK